VLAAWDAYLCFSCPVVASGSSSSSGGGGGDRARVFSILGVEETKEKENEKAEKN